MGGGTDGRADTPLRATQPPGYTRILTPVYLAV
jgi:hypothetical protein